MPTIDKVKDESPPLAEPGEVVKLPVFFSQGSFAYYFARVRANLGSEIKATNLINIFVSHRVVPYDDNFSSFLTQSTPSLYGTLCLCRPYPVHLLALGN